MGTWGRGGAWGRAETEQKDERSCRAGREWRRRRQWRIEEWLQWQLQGLLQLQLQQSVFICIGCEIEGELEDTSIVWLLIHYLECGGQWKFGEEEELGGLQHMTKSENWAMTDDAEQEGVSELGGDHNAWQCLPLDWIGMLYFKKRAEADKRGDDSRVLSLAKSQMFDKYILRQKVKEWEV